MEYITLSNGVKVPMLGYGVYQVTKDEAKKCVKDALEVGYRHIDTAQSYFNEEEVGEAIKESGVKREDIFLTTKVWLEHYGEEKAYESILESLRKLQTDYVDLLLLHQPFGDAYGAWRAVQRAYKEGKAKAIGISNFYVDRMVEFMNFVEGEKPMINQIEIHPLHQQNEQLEWMKKYNVIPEAWAPFGEGRGGLFENEVLKEIGAKYNKTPAQVMERWHIQRGIVIFPKTVHKERMIENFNIFDFELSKEDMEKISKLDTKTSSFFSHQDPKMVEWFAKMVEERKTNHDSSKEKKNW